MSYKPKNHWPRSLKIVGKIDEKRRMGEYFMILGWKAFLNVRRELERKNRHLYEHFTYQTRQKANSLGKTFAVAVMSG